MANLNVLSDFRGQDVFIGLDVHLKSWHVSLYLGQQYFKSFRQDPEPQILSEYLQKHFPGATYKCAFEAGFSGFWINRQLAKLGIDCIAVNAADVPQTNKGSITKTDQVDSKRLGISLQSGLLRGIFIPDEELESDRRLVRCHGKISRDLVRNKNRIKSHLYQMGIRLPVEFDNSHWTKNFGTWLTNLSLPHQSSRKTLDYLINSVDHLRGNKLRVLQDIRKLSETDRYKELYQKVIQVPGIGLITGMTFLVEIGNMHRFKNFDSLNSFIGLFPCEFSSGDIQRKGPLTIRQHKRLRELLIESAWTAIRQDPALALCYKKQKPRIGGKRAIIIVARKLLRRIRHIWLSNENYEIGVQ